MSSLEQSSYEDMETKTKENEKDEEKKEEMFFVKDDNLHS
jgi:hypothetical protein